MQSLRSKFFIWLIRNRHLLEFKLKPEVVDENFSVEEFRKGVDKTTSKMKMPRDIVSEKFKINGRKAEWISPANPEKDKILFYIHGGGFISGSCDTHRMHVAKFSRECNMRSLLFDYRLAPEHPFPAAVEDCIDTYKWLLSQGSDPENICIGGESAGATLTLSLLLALKDEKLPMPKAAFSISPVTDLRCLADSFKYNANKDIAPIGSWDIWMDYYIADNNPTDPILSPLFGNWENIPPVYICVGTYEIHFEDCVQMADFINKSGSKVILKKWDKMIHAFPIMAPLFPEATQALKEICDFVKEQLQQ